MGTQLISVPVTVPEAVTGVLPFLARTVIVAAQDKDGAYAPSLSVITFLGHSAAPVRSGPG